MHNRVHIDTFRLLILSFITIVTVSMIVLSPVFVVAVSDTSFPAKYYGYFDNNRVTSGAFVLTDTVADGSSDSIPIYVNSKATLISYIEGLHYNGNTQNKAGADYIIQTMRSDGTTYDRTRPNDSDVTDWANIVSNYPGTITWNMSTAAAGINSGSMNTYYSGNDIHWYDGAGSASPNGVIVFTNAKGDKEYMIKRNCGNPLGVISGIANSANYSLDPSIPLSNQPTVEAGSTIDMTPRISNSGTTDSGSSTQWKLTSFQVAPNKPVPQLNVVPTTSYNSDQSDPCKFYSGSGVSNCGSAIFTGQYQTASGSGMNVPVPYQDLNMVEATIGDLVAGTKMCYALSIQPLSSSSSQWRYSNPTCVTVGKKPKTQVLGGDLWVGVPFSGTVGPSNIDTSTVTKGAYTFGSWIEYGIFATGIVTGAGSGSAYSGQGLDSATVCKESLLTFANTNGDGTTACKDGTNIGQYATTRYMPDISASFLPDSSSVNIKTNDLSDQSKTGVFTGSGQISLAGGTLQAGRWLVINAPTADITITGNITYTTDLLKSIYDIPQLVIIAKNITIAESVTQVDAWLIAKSDSSGGGVLSTCTFTSSDPSHDSFPAFSPFPGLSNLGLDINKCSQRLTVNGPVMAQKLYLLRTAGSGAGATSGDPAEVFNLRPDAFLWSSARSVVSGRLQTVYSTELPPRL